MIASRFAAIASAFMSLSVTLIAAPPTLGKHFNILMIGNSYTQGNATARATNLDLQGLFDDDPDFSADITVRAESSASLQQHANNFATTSLITNSTNHWEVIVLQERSDRPGLAMKYGGSERTSLDNGGPILIGDFIKPFQPQASVVLLNTWARKLDNEDLVAEFDNSPEEMLSYTDQGYDRIRLNGSKWNYTSFTTIARAGDAWGEWYNTYGYNAHDLHGSDGSHQNDRGAYLAAAVLFETITGKTTVGNGYHGAVTGSIDGVSQVRLLQQQATVVTTAVAGMPGDYNQDGAVNAADYTLWRDRLGSSAALPNDGTPGVGPDDYARWTNHFNDVSDNNSVTANSVPEVGSMTCAAIAVAVVFGCRSVGAQRVHRFR